MHEPKLEGLLVNDAPAQTALKGRKGDAYCDVEICFMFIYDSAGLPFEHDKAPRDCCSALSCSPAALDSGTNFFHGVGGFSLKPYPHPIDGLGKNAGGGSG